MAPFSDPELSAQVGSAGIARLLRASEHVGPFPSDLGIFPQRHYSLQSDAGWCNATFFFSPMPVGAMLQDLSVSRQDIAWFFLCYDDEWCSQKRVVG